MKPFCFSLEPPVRQIILFSENFLRTSLVVQWLRLCISNAGGPGSIRGQGTSSHVLQLRPGSAKNKNKY